MRAATEYPKHPLVDVSTGRVVGYLDSRRNVHPTSRTNLRPMWGPGSWNKEKKEVQK